MFNGSTITFDYGNGNGNGNFLRLECLWIYKTLILLSRFARTYSSQMTVQTRLILSKITDKFNVSNVRPILVNMSKNIEYNLVNMHFDRLDSNLFHVYRNISIAKIKNTYRKNAPVRPFFLKLGEGLIWKNLVNNNCFLEINNKTQTFVKKLLLVSLDVSVKLVTIFNTY